LEEDVEVAEVSEVGEMVGKEQLGVLITMSRDISLNIFLFRDIPSVPIVETTPMPPRISLS
jgi:hypothetical protein